MTQRTLQNFISSVFILLLTHPLIAVENAGESSPLTPSMTWERKASQWALDAYAKSLEVHKEEVAQIRSGLNEAAGKIALPDEVKAKSKKGLIVFSRPIPHEITRKSPPTLQEAKAVHLSASLAADEWEGVQFGIWATEDIREFSWKVSDLVHTDGKTKIGAENVRTYYAYNLIHPQFQRKKERTDGDIVAAVALRTDQSAAVPGSKKDKKPGKKIQKGWGESPCALLDLASINLAKDEASAFWVDVYAPRDAAEGEYSGEVRLSVGAENVASIPLKVTVYPFILDQAKEWGRGAFVSKTRNREELIQMREHGMNMMSTWWDNSDKVIKIEEGKITADFSEYQNYVKLLDELGFAGPHMVFLGGSSPTIENAIFKLLKRPEVHDARSKGNGNAFEKVDLSAPFPQYLCDVVRQFHEQMKAVGHGDLPVCILDEPDHEPRPFRRDFYIKVYDMVQKGAPEVPTYGVFYHEGDEDRLSRHHSVWCSNRPAPKLVEACRSAGKSLWTYGYNAEYGGGLEGRFDYGFMPWVYGAKGSFFWANYWHKKDVFDPFSVENMSTASLPTPEGPLGTFMLKSIRENIDDGRYIRMLDKMIQAAKKGSQNARTEAAIHEKFLDSLRTFMFEKMNVMGGNIDVSSIAGLEIVNLQGEKFVVSANSNLYEISEFLRGDIAKRITVLQSAINKG